MCERETERERADGGLRTNGAGTEADTHMRTCFANAHIGEQLEGRHQQHVCAKLACRHHNYVCASSCTFARDVVGRAIFSNLKCLTGLVLLLALVLFPLVKQIPRSGIQPVFSRAPRAHSPQIPPKPSNMVTKPSLAVLAALAVLAPFAPEAQGCIGVCACTLLGDVARFSISGHY